MMIVGVGSSKNDMIEIAYNTVVDVHLCSQVTLQRDDIIWGLGSLPAYAKRARARLRHFVLIF